LSNVAQCALGRYPRPAVVHLRHQHANAQDASATAGASPASSTLGPVDYQFVAEANLGAPFQVDSGRLGEKRAENAAVRDYAHLMVVTHIPVVDAMNTILKRKGIMPPPDTLLHGAYNTMIATLKAEHGVVFDRDYVDGQVEYQKGNTALFQTPKASRVCFSTEAGPRESQVRIRLSAGGRWIRTIGTRKDNYKLPFRDRLSSLP
jgi:predicted outer membrane protein